MNEIKRILFLILAACAATAAAAAPAGAASWTPVSSGTTNEIRAVEYQSPTRLWFATGAGEIFRRMGDGSFERTANLPGFIFRDIEFRPAGDIGFAITVGGDVLRSADAGATWKEVTGLDGANDACTSLEPLDAAYSVRFAGDDVVYLFAGGRKLLRSTESAGADLGATDNWIDVNMTEAGSCKVPAHTAYHGITDGYFIPEAPNRGWVTTDYFGETWFTTDITSSDTAVKRSPASWGYGSPTRLVADAANPANQWGFITGVDMSDNRFAVRTTSGWESTLPWELSGQRYDRTVGRDIATAGGTVVFVGDAGMIENSNDGVRFFYSPATGALTNTDWLAVDLADANRAAVGGKGGALALSADAATVPDLEAPTGTIVGPTAVTAGAPQQFTAQITDEPGGSGVDAGSVRWHAYGIPEAAGNPVTLTFPTAGNTVVRATFRDLAGNAGEATLAVVVNPSVVGPPVVTPPVVPQARLSGRVRSARRGRRVRLSVRGRLIVPRGFARARACPQRRAVVATVRRGRRTLRSARLNLSTRCAFRKTILLRRGVSRRTRRLSLKLAYAGTTGLRGVTRSYVVRLRRR